VADDAKTVTEFVEVSRKVEDYQYFHVSPKVAKEVFPEVAAGQVIVLKDFDEGKAIFKGELKSEKFEEFLQENMVPTVSEISQKTIELVFKANARKGVFLFRSAAADNTKQLDEEFKKVAIAAKAKDLVFSQMDIKEGWGQRVANYFGVEESMMPVVEIVEMKEELLRYRLTGKIGEAELKEFVENWRKGVVPRFLKSEPEPTENAGPVYKLVGKAFKHEILDNDDDIIVKFYAPWCGHCKKLEPVFKSLAESLVGDKKLKFYEVDSTKNDIEGHPIHGFPVIKLFPGKDKANVATYNGDRTEADIAKFIKEKCSHPVDIPELKAKDEAAKNKDDL